MRSDPTALPAFLAKTGAAGAGASSSTARKQDNGGDDFASVMRKRTSDEGRDKSVSKNETPAREGMRRADRDSAQTNAQARAQARAEGRERRPASDADQGKSDADMATQDSASNQTAATKGGAKRADAAGDADHKDSLPLDWPPAGLLLPSLLDGATTAVGAVAGAAGDVLLGGAAASLTGGLPGALAGGLSGGLAAALPSGLRALGIASDNAANLANAAGASGADGLPLAGADATAGTNATSTDAASNGRVGALTLPGLASTATANASAATATQPPPADAAQLLPMGLAQFKDALEGALGGKRDELPAAAAAFALNGSQAPSDNGLARTATVNPLTALTSDVNTDQFGETIGTQLTYMANEKISHAHIKVSPNDMGTIEVSLKLDGDRVHADFSSPQADVRQALEQSLPKLREMLGQQGFQLAQADVGHRQQQQAHSSGSQGSGERGGQTGREGFGGNSQGDASVPAAVVRVARGLVDAYA